MSERLNDILVPYQHGFRKDLLCTTQLLTTTQSIMSEIDKGISVKAAILDFSKAFDKVPYDLLVTKMESYNFPKVVVAWVLEFLKEGRVFLQVSVSEIHRVTSGASQGSLLFKMMIIMLKTASPSHQELS